MPHQPQNPPFMNSYPFASSNRWRLRVTGTCSSGFLKLFVDFATVPSNPLVLSDLLSQTCQFAS
jgi:hypothetical protein